MPAFFVGIRIWNIDFLSYTISLLRVSYEASILRTFRFLKAHSDSGKDIVERTSDIPWKYIKLIFSNTLSQITRYSFASSSVSETCK